MACPIVNPTTCCEILIDHETQLIPPALENTVVFTKTVEANIEHVCPEKVVVCGVIHKILTYTAVLENGTLVPGFQVFDDIPFQCVIDRDDANEGDLFEVTGTAVVCEVLSQEQNFGIKAGLRVAFKFRESEIIKVCVRKVIATTVSIELESIIVGGCNVPFPVNGVVLVNGIGFEGIPVSFTVIGPATVSPTTVTTGVGGTFSTNVTPTGPGSIIVTATATINGVPFTVTSPIITSPCV
ncbi:hypothetical protein [Bacillus cihuensis]|uniref:hypothetical protein n=1 Tax=Bacillus cihuensis TaxID=1208599 RepID=UPI000424129F|nr:hypothetical protein [Bacillus cihuensis]